MVSKPTEECYIDNKVVKMKVSKNISTEIWNCTNSVDDRHVYSFKIGSLDMNIVIYPKGDSDIGSGSVTAYVTQYTSQDHANGSFLWKFQKQGNGNCPVNLETDKTWTYRHVPEPALQMRSMEDL